MEMITLGREKGQVLVMVGLMVVVLFGFVALALDGGNVYAGRRRMQNAADAGALAGARLLCFEEGKYGDYAQAADAAEDTAMHYAVNQNGAQTATVHIDDYAVTVHAHQTLDTFFAGVIGISKAEVGAGATAKCGAALSAGHLWPLAFKYDVYSDVITCGQEFLVFSSKAQNWGGLECAGPGCTCVDPDEGITETNDASCDDKCNCADLGVHLAMADRGWLLFSDPDEPYTFPSACKPSAETSCGEPRLACWLAEDYPDEIAVGDCIAGKEGVVQSNDVVDGIESRIGEILNIILWDEEDCDIPADSCPGTPYHVANFGCVRVEEYIPPSEHFFVPSCGDPTEACKSAKNIAVIKATKVCNGMEGYDQCIVYEGGSGGDPPDDLELRAVSLVK